MRISSSPIRKSAAGIRAGARGILAAGLCAACLLVPAARAGTLFSEDFESASGLSDGNWSTIGNGIIKTPGYNSTNALGFSAKGASGDAWSKAINVSISTSYWVVVDYKETGAGGYLGFEEYSGTGATGTDLGETWVWGDGAYTSLAVFNGSGTTYHHYVQKITTAGTTHSIKFKLEDWSGNAGPVGHVFFDNLQLLDAAPPTTVTRIKWQEVVR